MKTHVLELGSPISLHIRLCHSSRGWRAHVGRVRGAMHLRHGHGTEIRGSKSRDCARAALEAVEVLVAGIGKVGSRRAE